MGDMADYYRDSAFYYFDPYPDYWGDVENANIACKNCGKGSLHWEWRDRWMLVTDRGERHDCGRFWEDED